VFGLNTYKTLEQSLPLMMCGMGPIVPGRFSTGRIDKGRLGALERHVAAPCRGRQV